MDASSAGCGKVGAGGSREAAKRGVIRWMMGVCMAEKRRQYSFTRFVDRDIWQGLWAKWAMKLAVGFSHVIGRQGALHVSQICTHISPLAQYMGRQHLARFVALRHAMYRRDLTTSCRPIGR